MSTATETDVRQAWVAELTRIEASLKQTGSLGDDGPIDTELIDDLLDRESWTPSQMPGPIPSDLIEWAEGLLRSADETSRRLVARLTSLRNERGFAERVSDTSPTRGEGNPVYLDVTA